MWKRTISKNAEAEEEAGRSGNEAAGRDYDRLIKTSLSGHLGEAVREVQVRRKRKPIHFYVTLSNDEIFTRATIRQGL